MFAAPEILGWGKERGRRSKKPPWGPRQKQQPGLRHPGHKAELPEGTQGWLCPLQKATAPKDRAAVAQWSLQVPFPSLQSRVCSLHSPAGRFELGTGLLGLPEHWGLAAAPLFSCLECLYLEGTQSSSISVGFCPSESENLCSCGLLGTLQWLIQPICFC